MDRSFRRAGRIIAVGALAVLAACAGSAPPSPIVAGQLGSARQNLSQPRPGRLLYVSNGDSNSVTVYRADQNDPQPLRTVTAGVSNSEGVAVDARGTLYVANRTANTVTEYRSGELQPFRTISDGLQDPLGLAVDAQGTVYVGNRDIGAQEVYVTEYARGSVTPTLTITFPKHNLPAIGGVAVDNARSLYVVTSFSGGTTTVTKFLAGSAQGVDLRLKGIGAHGDGLAVDAAGNLYAGTTRGAIAVYAPGTTKPLRTIKSGLLSPAFFVVDAAGALFVPNQKPGPNAGNVLEYRPAAKHAKFVIGGFDYPTGTAVSP